MKRISTYILLLLVLTLSVHPILSLHFCGDDLKSLNIGMLSNDSMCCAPVEVGDNEHARTPLQSLIVSDNSCCSTTNLEIVTDNFTHGSSQSIESSSDISFIPGWFIINHLINLTAPEVTNTPKFNFHTQRIYLKTLDFLSLICVYRL